MPIVLEQAEYRPLENFGCVCRGDGIDFSTWRICRGMTSPQQWELEMTFSTNDPTILMHQQSFGTRGIWVAPRTVRDSGSPWSDSDFADLVLKRRILDWLFDMEMLWESRWFLVSMLCLEAGRLTVGSRVAVGCL